MHQNFLALTLISAIVLAIPLPAQDAVPPPPVNQLIGIVDALLENPTESDCRVCHDSGLPDRHHLLMGTIIPDQTSAPYGVAGTPYECLSCHAEDTSSGIIVFLVERDCLVCHTYIPDSRPSTPHHITQDAADRHCSVCHGSVVQDYDDDHYIPDYDISNVTPDPVCKTWDGPICVSGGCYVCHTEDPTATPAIAAYSDLHHGARFNCILCHDVHGNIRDCESCHGPDSLHNIQADSDNPANLGIIIPGEENLGWGHIGNGWDCFGCHESFNGASTSARPMGYGMSSTPQTGATIPSVSGLSANSVTAEKDTELVIYGSGFLNSMGETTFIPIVVIDDGSDSVTLEAVTQEVDRITVIVPSSLPAGLYDLRVVKDDKKSNKEILSVIPNVVIDSARLKKGAITVRGSGFNEHPEGEGSGLGVTITNSSGIYDCSITSWTDVEVNGDCSTDCGDVVLTSIYGSASTEIPCKNTGDNSGPASEGKGKTCSDGVDNDSDGLIDCLDGDCSNNKACS